MLLLLLLLASVLMSLSQRLSLTKEACYPCSAPADRTDSNGSLSFARVEPRALADTAETAATRGELCALTDTLSVVGGDCFGQS